MRFAERVESTIISAASACFPEMQYLRDAPIDREYLVDRAHYELYKGTHNWDASPGYPFQTVYSDLRTLTEEEPTPLVSLAVLLLERWLLTPHEELRGMGSVELMKRGYVWPNRVFIKQEPHSSEKARTGRWRVIVSVCQQQVLAERVIYGPYHREMVRLVDVLPNCIGLGLTDDSIDVICDKAKKTTDSFGLTSSDQSGYDWRLFWFWSSILACIEISRTGATGHWANAIRNLRWVNIMSLFVLSDGRMFRLLHAAVQRSGDLNTGHGNTELRIALNIAVRLYCKEIGFSMVPKSLFPANAMGDDCFESFGCPLAVDQVVDFYAGFGFKVTDVVVSSDGSLFEFCSTRFRILPDGSRIITPLSWPRMLFRLLCQEYHSSFLQQFCYELRHLDGRDGGISLRDLLAYIDRVGWIRESSEDPINVGDIQRSLHCAEGMSKSSKPKKGRAGASKPHRDAELRVVAKQVSQKMPTKALSYQLKTVSDPLTHQDLAIISYLHTLGDPWVEDPAGVPLMAGGTLMRRTVKAQIKFEVQAVANSSGFACVALNCDGWVGDATLPPIRYASYNGGVQGYPLWYTSSTYVGTNTPLNGITTATAGVNAVQMPLLDGQVTSTSNVRMVAAGMRVFSDAAVNTAQGKLAICATSRPYGSAAQGSLAGTNYATVSTIPTDVMSFQAEACAGWRAGHSLYAVAIPSDPEAFTFFNPPPSGAAAYSYPQLCAILSGAAANQTFTAQVVMDYEFDIGISNLTGVDTDPLVVTSAADLVPHIAQMHVGKTGMGNSNKALGAKAFLAQTAMTRPAKLAALIRPSPSLLSTIGGAAKAALGWAASKGLDYVKGFARGVPVLGGLIGALGL